LLVSELICNLERLKVPALGYGKVALRLRYHALLVVSHGSAAVIANFFIDSERLEVPALSCGKVTLLLGNDAKLMVRRCSGPFIALPNIVFCKANEKVLCLAKVSKGESVVRHSLHERGKLYVHFELLSPYYRGMKVRPVKSERNVLFAQVSSCYCIC
jgi:hypothetical protein